MGDRSRFGMRGHGHCLREGRKLRPPELLEVCAALGGEIAAMMVGAAWFGLGDDLSESQRRDRRSILGLCGSRLDHGFSARPEQGF